MNRIPLPENVTAKVGRAEQHLSALRNLIDEFAATRPLVAEPFFAHQPGAWGARLRAVNSTPTQVPLLVGDFLHNLRSSLDYLARALVETSGNQPKDGIGGTTFPIADKFKPEGTLRVKGTVDPDIGLIIESHQPYKAAVGAVESHPLQLLHTFSNIDKHRALHLPLMAAIEPVVMLVAHIEPLPVGFIQPTLKPFTVGDDIVPPIVPVPQSTKIEVIAALNPIVALEDAFAYEDGTVDLLDQLDYMLKTVRDRVIPSFRGFFSDPWPRDYFVHNPVLGPMGYRKTPEEATAAVDGMVEFLVTNYGSDRFLALGLVPGLTA